MMTLEDLATRLTILEAKVAAMAPPPEVDLSKDWNDPVVRKDPKQWLERGGASYEGRKFSECPPDYLNALASLFDWQAKKDDEAGKTYVNKKGETVPSSQYKRLDSARARAWAKQNATGAQASVRGVTRQVQDLSRQPGDGYADGDLPF